MSAPASSQQAGISRLMAYVAVLEFNNAQGHPTSGEAIVMRARPINAGPKRQAALITYNDIRAACGMQPLEG